jgi:effector-binding domain-containing protein
MAEAATTIHQGPYHTVSGAYNAIMAWCEANGYQPVSPCREIYLTDPKEVGEDQSKNITEVQFPVKKA